MQRLVIASALAALLTACASDMTGMPGGRMPAGTAAGTTPDAGRTVMVGGAPMYPTRDIVDNAVNSRDHTTLVAAVKAAGLVDTLKGPGPFTVFAPTNAAFAALPAGTVDGLLQPAAKPMLVKVLTYHVVPGRIDAAALGRQIAAGNGRATLATASGGTLVATMRGPDIVLTDAKGGMARVTTADVYQSNGVIHVVDKVLLPN
ncbi:MAG: fasciclin domain-containing protein [Xylophilus ampelinus]